MNTLNDKTSPGIALITGASSGVGAAFAHRLAADGHDLILTARRTDRLEALSAELQQKHNITAEVLTADLSTDEDIARVEARIAELDDLALLVNNAGFGLMGSFLTSQVADHLSMIEVHVNATVRLCHAALPGMIAKGSGGIINVSSVSAFSGLGRGNVTYSATKAFLNFFSERLQSELAGSGVRVQALCPGFTVTGFHSTPELKKIDMGRVPYWAWMPAEKVVDRSLAALKRGRVIVVPGLLYQVLVAILRRPLLMDLARWVSYRRNG